MLGIGGGLIFAPVLLWLNLPPHQALATSSFAIVPTALAGTIVHLQSGSLPTRSALAIGLAGFGSALVFGGLGGLAAGWMLLAMQTAVYVLLAFTIKEAPKAETNEDAETAETEEKVEDAEIEQEKAQYLAIFAKHNLNSLAVAKPGLIETRFNKASEAVFEGLEDDTQQIFELDTPVIPD